MQHLTFKDDKSQVQRCVNIRLVKRVLTPFETKLTKYANNGEILLEVCMSFRAHCNTSNTLIL